MKINEIFFSSAMDRLHIIFEDGSEIIINSTSELKEILKNNEV